MLERAYHKVNSRKAWVGESFFKKSPANIVNGSKQIPPLSDFPPTHSWKQFISEKPEKDSLKAVDVPQSLDLSLDSTHLPSWVWEVYCYHIISIVSKTLAFKIFVKFRSDLKLYRQWNRKKFGVENNLSITRGGTMTFDCWGLIHHPLEASSSFNLPCRHPRLLW